MLHLKMSGKMMFGLQTGRRVIKSNLFRFEHSMTNTNKETIYDIIIAGGGMVGTTLACRLGQMKHCKNLRILLLEGSPHKEYNFTPEYSNRVSALNAGSKNILDSIGAWKIIEEIRCKPVKKIQVWESSSDAMISFNHDYLSKDIAYIVENDVLLSAVTNKLSETTKNVEVIYSAKIKGCQLPPKMSLISSSTNLAKVEMEDGSTYECRLLIGADGANSKVRPAMGVQYLTWNYDQSGIVATLQLSEPSDNIVAWQRFLPNGPIAILPLSNELSSLVWTVKRSDVKDLLELPNDSFVDAVNDALWRQYDKNPIIQSASQSLNSVLETLQLGSNAVRQLHPTVVGVTEGSRAAFPLAFGHAVQYAGLRVALVGDAAHRIHPLAGQGVNLGFGDVECLSDILDKAVEIASDLGDIDDLRAYETKRQRHNIPIMLAVDGLQKLYNNSLVPVMLLRSLGLQLTHVLQPVKKLIMNQVAA